jgi:hypothetical protein
VERTMRPLARKPNYESLRGGATNATRRWNGSHRDGTEDRTGRRILRRIGNARIHEPRLGAGGNGLRPLGVWARTAPPVPSYRPDRLATLGHELASGPRTRRTNIAEYFRSRDAGSAQSLTPLPCTFAFRFLILS